jgi:hypothetical protein
LPETYEELNVYTSFVLSDHAFADGGAYWPTQEFAKATVALTHLTQLRKVYWGDWKPDFTNTERKFVIECERDIIKTDSTVHFNFFLAFSTRELRDHFFKHHRELIEIAKPLLF